MEKVLSIEGMTCGHCKMHVEKALSGIDGVTSAKVELEKKKAIVEMDDNVSEAALSEAVAEAGYQVTAISGK
ncbi:MAG: copper ion binding protein [Nitrospinota bacterium]|nr:copper ion binding protein [Nitrospinota bacterium]